MVCGEDESDECEWEGIDVDVCVSFEEGDACEECEWVHEDALEPAEFAWDEAEDFAEEEAVDGGE